MKLQESSELPYYINGKLYVPLYDENGNVGFSIYDKNGSEVGTAEEKEGFEFYKQNETGDYITFFKEEDSGIQLWGIKDANGNVIIEPQYDAILTMFHRWYGDNNIKTKISNGVALVVMNEVSWDNMGSGGVNHYGYVDLKGNETLSEATKATCKTSQEIINEVTDEYFDEDEGEEVEQELNPYGVSDEEWEEIQSQRLHERALNSTYNNSSSSSNELAKYDEKISQYYPIMEEAYQKFMRDVRSGGYTTITPPNSFYELSRACTSVGAAANEARKICRRNGDTVGEQKYERIWEREKRLYDSAYNILGDLH